MEKTSITWKTSNLGVNQGFIGSIPLFYISRTDGSRAGQHQYQVRTALPGIQKMAKGRTYKTLTDARKRCEILFDRFFEHLLDNRFPDTPKGNP